MYMYIYIYALRPCIDNQWLPTAETQNPKTQNTKYETWNLQ